MLDAEAYARGYSEKNCIGCPKLIEFHVRLSVTIATLSTLCVDRNALILTSCSFDKHGLVLIIFGKQVSARFQ